MAERWIQLSEKILHRIESLGETEKKDRLDLVRSMTILLSALERSLVGWKQWINNPDMMTKFTQNDLQKMNKKLSEFTNSFIKFDIEATRLGSKRGLKTRKKPKKKEERPEVYVA